MTKKILFLFALIFFLSSTAKAQSDRQLRVSLITCFPGQEVFELYGHTAIRITDGQSDMVYNFGLFSFNKPNFIYRFVKGETDYAVGSYPMIYFLPEYIERNSKVVEQILNLSNNQAKSLQARLDSLCLPENREYRYNYVLNNCATRPRDLIEETIGGINFPTPVDTTLTFRDIMRRYSPNYPWYQFGIDLALGSGIDRIVTAREQMFAPVFLMEAFATAKTTGNQPLVRQTIILFDGSESPTLPPTPWYLTPLFLSIAALIAIFFLTINDIRKLHTSRLVDSLWFLICGLTGILVWFLIFISEHEATSPNYLGIWLNPFCLFPSIAIWIKSCKKWLYFYHFINFALVLSLTILWWSLPQSANAAFFPLMLCTAARSVGYIITYKKCEKRNK